MFLGNAKGRGPGFNPAQQNGRLAAEQEHRQEDEHIRNRDGGLNEGEADRDTRTEEDGNSGEGEKRKAELQDGQAIQRDCGARCSQHHHEP
jgi:hypothetical protein